MTKRCRASRGCAGSPSHDVRILFRDADEQSSISIEIQIYPNIYPYMYFIIFIPDSSKFSDSQEHHNSLQHTGTWKFERFFALDMARCLWLPLFRCGNSRNSWWILHFFPHPMLCLSHVSPTTSLGCFPVYKQFPILFQPIFQDLPFKSRKCEKKMVGSTFPFYKIPLSMFRLAPSRWRKTGASQVPQWWVCSWSRRWHGAIEFDRYSMIYDI